MRARCPKCQTLYHIEEKDLRAGRGNLVCGQCDIIFQAAGTPNPPPPESRHAPMVNDIGLDDDAPLESLRAEPRADPPLFDGKAFGSLRKFGSRSKVSRPWAFATLLAVFAWLGQLLFFESENLSKQPELRPWLEKFCPRLGCRVAEFRDLSRIEVVERSLTPARDGVDGLEFRAILSNDSDQSQPYPRLKLTLSQYNGEAMAQRVFTPREYLKMPAAPKMASGEVVEILLIIANPGKDVGGFAFELL